MGRRPNKTPNLGNSGWTQQLIYHMINNYDCGVCESCSMTGCSYWLLIIIKAKRVQDKIQVHQQ